MTAARRTSSETSDTSKQMSFAQSSRRMELESFSARRKCAKAFGWLRSARCPPAMQDKYEARDGTLDANQAPSVGKSNSEAPTIAKNRVLVQEHLP